MRSMVLEASIVWSVERTRWPVSAASNDLGGFKIAHLTDEDDFRRLAKGGTKGGREILCVGPDLALVDRAFFVVVEKFDRVLDRDYVVALGLVDLIDDGCKGRALARTCRTCKQNDAVADIANIGELRRQPKRVEARYLVRDNAHDDRKGVSLLEDVDAEATLSGERIAEVGGSVLGELGRGFGVLAEYGHRDHLRLERGKTTQTHRRGRIERTADLDLRFLPAGEVQIADIL